MAKVSMNTVAPDFSLKDFQGMEVRLSQFKGNQHVLLIFNRGFM
jgi:peroxiredoxin